MTGESYDTIKRRIDIVIAVVALLLTAPVQLVVAVLVRLKLGSPVLFKQPRPGKDHEIFTLVKFRTMRPVDRDAKLVTDAERLTSFGAKLRSTSLDELPTLWNVLKGDMSLVGPRPLLVEYLGHYDTRQRRRHEVRPGITGLAQISGRNVLSWQERFEKDLEYIDRRSLKLDMIVIIRTTGYTIRRQHISAPGDATMPRFEGLSKSAK